ncbi:hypothetical protein EW026_g6345 [Hermanssonia centrifuga]|uniref:Uncharacterized protein n=1 Tax=Hermanssonia centrifuga TaxID=98765 RepID=A0A4S4KBD4_9APHY|nr:hypothetical protein EW026_g6345 [Hermanssonia centrifuga]
MAPIRLGFIGLSSTGWASISLAPPLFNPLLASLYSITALCTSSEASAEAAAVKYSELAGHAIKAYHGDQGFVDIANDPNVDMVAVSIKMPHHLKAVWPAIEAGKDIFIEWTVGSSFEETLKIAEAAKKKGIKVLVGAQATQGVFLKKVKELVESGKIGRVLSTSLVTTSAYFGSSTTEGGAYLIDINNGANALTIPVGHFLVALSYAIGDFTEISASGIIQHPTVRVLGADGKPTDKTLQKTAHDQVSLSGIVRGQDKNTGAVFATFQVRGGFSLDGERGRGRTVFKWTIDGEDGTIEVQDTKEEGAGGAFIQMGEKRVLLNGEEVTLELGEEDQLGNAGKAWLEFARGGRYVNIDDAVRVHRVLDAAQKSIAEGKKFVLE